MKDRTLQMLLVLLTSVAPLVAQPQKQSNSAPPAVSRQTFDRWIVEISNAGRWGAQDELGTLNLITPEKRRRAAQSVRDGVSVSLAREMVAGPDMNAVAPMRLRQDISTDEPEVTWTDDEITLMFHGWAYSHIDALSHTLYRGRMYNGYGKEHLTPAPPQLLSIQAMQGGLITRGVLVDVPRLKGVPYLEPGTAITVEDLEQWERQRGVKVEPGDVLLIRTGRWARAQALGNWEVSKAAAGPHPSIAPWLRARGVAALGGDVSNEIYPSVVPGLSNPLHQLALVSMGMPLLDNLDFEAVAREAAARSRWTFLFIAAPLRVHNGSGSPLNPLAIF